MAFVDARHSESDEGFLTLVCLRCVAALLIVRSWRSYYYVITTDYSFVSKSEIV